MNMKLVTVVLNNSDIFHFTADLYTTNDYIKDEYDHPSKKGHFFNFLKEKLVDTGCYKLSELETADVTVEKISDINNGIF